MGIVTQVLTMRGSLLYSTLLILAMIHKGSCITCYVCENMEVGTDIYYGTCGLAGHHDWQTIDDPEQDGCFTSVLPGGFATRSVDSVSATHEDLLCENYGQPDNFIGYCYCKEDLCNNNLCEYCTNGNANNLN